MINAQTMKLPQIAFLLNSAVTQYAVQSRLNLWLVISRSSS